MGRTEIGRSGPHPHPRPPFEGEGVLFFSLFSVLLSVLCALRVSVVIDLDFD